MSNAQDNPADFMRQLWSSMGFGLPGMMTPTLDVDDIERRITDLRAVEGWLKMNLSMLQMTIQGLEVQRAALSAVRVMSQSGEGTSANPFANPALWTWPFPEAPATAPDNKPPAAEDAPPADEPPRKTSRRK